MRILFITSTRLGDAVLSTGLLDYLVRTYPGARFTIACGPVAAGVFDRLPGLDRKILVVKRRFDLHWLDLWRQVVGRQWDLAIDLRGSALTFLIRAKRRAVMRGGRRPGHRTTHLAGVLDLPRVPMPVAWVSDPDVAAATGWLPEGGPIIGLGPTANWDGKIWPPSRFVELFDLLRERLPGARAAIFGGPGDKERELAAPVLAALPDAIDLVGKLSVPEVSACLMRCALFVGNDSGLMHLAASAGTPTLGLFGPTLAAEYAPAGWCTAVALAEGEPGAATMEDLPVAAVFRASLALLERAALPVQTEPA